MYYVLFIWNNLSIAPKIPLTPINPCMPSPCGSNAECRVIDKRPVCSCLTGMLGAPPNCRPECIIHADCPTKLACVQNKCRDPCKGSCGFNAQCLVVNHQPVCTCIPGFQGDPFSGCNAIPGKFLCSQRVCVAEFSQLSNCMMLLCCFSMSMSCRFLGKELSLTSFSFVSNAGVCCGVW